MWAVMGSPGKQRLGDSLLLLIHFAWLEVPVCPTDSSWRRARRLGRLPATGSLLQAPCRNGQVCTWQARAQSGEFASITSLRSPAQPSIALLLKGWRSSVGVDWGLVRSAESQPPPQTSRCRPITPARPPRDHLVFSDHHSVASLMHLLWSPLLPARNNALSRPFLSL